MLHRELTHAERDQLRTLINHATRQRIAHDRRQPKLVMSAALLAALATLVHQDWITPGELEAWTDRIILGRTCDAIARDMGLSRARVNKLEQQADKKITALLERQEAA